jgi:hypothetical protein
MDSYVACMEKVKIAYSIVVGKPEGKMINLWHEEIRG